MCIFCLSAKAFKDIVNYLFHLIISIVLVLVVVLVMTIGRTVAQGFSPGSTLYECLGLCICHGDWPELTGVCCTPQ